MDWLIWIGALVSLIGLAGLVYCIMSAAKVLKLGLDEDGMKAKLQGLIALNMGALAISSIGLMMVVIGILLGK